MLAAPPSTSRGHAIPWGESEVTLHAAFLPRPLGVGLRVCEGGENREVKVKTRKGRKRKGGRGSEVRGEWKGKGGERDGRMKENRSKYKEGEKRRERGKVQGKRRWE